MAALMKFTVTTTDDKTYEAKAVMADLIRYDVLRNRLNFPPREGNEFVFMGLVTFCALLRTGQIPAESKPEEFLNTIANLEPADEEDEAEFPATAGN